MNVILPLCYIIIFAFIIYKSRFFRSSGLSYKVLLGIFGVKLLSAFALHYLYTLYYTSRIEADIFKYFDDSYIMFQSFTHKPSDFFRLFFGYDLQNESLDVYFKYMNFWVRKIDYGLFNDNRTIIRINVIIMFFSWGNIFVHHIFASFISLFAFLLIFKVFDNLFPNRKTVLIVCIFLIPSSLFWASAMLKECIVMLGLGIFLYAMYFLIQRKYSIRLFILFFIGILLLMTIKIYVLAALIPAVIAYYCSLRFEKIPTWKIYFGLLLFFICIVICNQFLQGIPFLETISAKRNNFIVDSIYYSSARSYIDIGILKPTLWAFLIETPLAIYRSLSMPYFWNITQAIEILPALENLALIILVLGMIFYYKKPVAIQAKFIWFCLFFSIGLLWFVGITTPVVGAIVRYKMPILPFLYTIFALLIDWQKIFQQFRKN